MIRSENKTERNNFIKKKILTLCLAVMMLFGSTITANAAVCKTSPTGVHNYTTPVQVTESVEIKSSHPYVKGEQDGLGIMDVCNVTTYWAYFEKECRYCGALSGVRSYEVVSAYHNKCRP